MLDPILQHLARRYFTLPLCLQRSCRIDAVDNRTYLEHEMYELGADKLNYCTFIHDIAPIGVLEILIHN